jgi:hypothetical protein
MSSTETLLWAALPHGRDTSAEPGIVRLSVFVSPRLFPDQAANGSLDPAHFPLTAQWTQRMIDDPPAFQVTFRTPGGESPLSDLLEPRLPDLLPEAWNALFGEIRVDGFRIDDLLDVPTATLPTATAHEEIKNEAENVALTAFMDTPPASDPAIGTIRDLVTQFSTRDSQPRIWRSGKGRSYRVISPQDAFARAVATRRQRALADQFRRGVRHAPALNAIEAIVPWDEETGTEAVAVGDLREPGHGLAVQIGRFRTFHTLAEMASRRRLARRTQPAQHDADEFHAVMGEIGSHPELLRRLGLVFELEIPAADLPMDQGIAWIRAEPRWRTSVNATSYAPWTAVDVGTFWPVRRASGDTEPPAPSLDGDPLTGLLLAGEPGPRRQLEAIQLDLEGTLHKLATVGDTRRFPSLRNGGFAIVRRNQAEIVNEQVSRAHAYDTDLDATVPVLTAEDLNRGYRIDVWSDQVGSWKSLHEQDLTYHFPAADGQDRTVGVRGDRLSAGFVQLAVATTFLDEEETEPGLLVHETLGRWNGWSLAVPHPSRSVTAEGRVEDAPPPPQLRRVTWTQDVVEGSLPRLRFGHGYRFRVRTVDLVGNSLTPDEADARPSQAMLIIGGDDEDGRTIYRRFDPISGPVLAPRNPLRAGETPTHLVLRSDAGVSPEEYRSQHTEYAWSHERHIVPPKIAQFTAELHGQFDPAFGGSQSAIEQRQATYDMAARDRGSLLDTTDPQVETAEAGYTVHAESSLTLPYLPDPFARGVVFRNLPGTCDDVVCNQLWGDATESGAIAYQTERVDGTVTRVSFAVTDGAWPDAVPFRLHLQPAERFERPVWNAEDRVLSISLPQGETVTFRISSHSAVNDLDQLALWDWTRKRIGRGAQPEDSPEIATLIGELQDFPQLAERRAETGDLGFLTPGEEVTLVHAVQRPVTPPELSIPAAPRSTGESFASLENRISIHAKSTARIELLAEWADRVDQPDDPFAHPRFSARIAEQQILAPAMQDARERAESWNRKNRLALMSYGAREETDFAQQFVTRQGEPLEPEPEDASFVRHEFGDTRYREAMYRAVGVTRFAEYFPSEITADASQISQMSASVPVTILSSARPAAPVISRVVPSFRWRRESLPDGEWIRHRWGGLRVYLARPWFGSGDGERLGVVYWDGPEGPIPADIEPVVTRWGRDPIWTGAQPLPPRPNGEEFFMAAEIGTGLSIAGFEATHGGSFAVAAHEVQFDEVSGLWFTDIQVGDGASYFSFVRLALARYQARSIENAHLSPIVVADVFQIAPHRVVTIVADAEGANALKVTVSGEANVRSTGPDGVLLAPNEVQARLERRYPGTNDELGWLSFGSQPNWLEDAEPADGTLLWEGTIPLPDDISATPTRLVIQEFESFFARKTGGEFTTKKRLVFADTIEL